VLAFAVAISVATGIGCGLVPAWWLSHAQPAASLRPGAGVTSRVAGGVRLSDLLVAGQVALALVLLVGAGLLIRSLERLLRVDPGYESRRVLTLQVAAPPAREFARDPGSFARHYERVLEKVQELGEVESAAVVSSLPFSAMTSSMTFYRSGRSAPAAGDLPSAGVHSVTPDYFRTMGIPLLRGRVFDGSERPTILPPGIEVTRRTSPRSSPASRFRAS